MRIALPTLALAVATLTTAQYSNQSALFNLILVSDDETINGDTLSSCHEGAAISSLCLSNSITPSKPGSISPGRFTFNTSETAAAPNATLGAPGWLTWLLIGGNFELSQPLGFTFDPTSNVAHPQLTPSREKATVLAFDENDLLNIQSAVDDTQNPPAPSDVSGFYRWYACLTYYTGYQYQTLNWVLGGETPQNPSCVKVDVKRQFI